MNEQAKRFVTMKVGKTNSNVVECTEQSRYCLKRFIPTRPGQTDVCIKCLEMLGELEPLPANKHKGSIWS